jgi:hypothetical protein
MSALPAASNEESPPRSRRRIGLKAADGPESWKVFNDPHGGLIRARSLKPGLTQDEAHEHALLRRAKSLEEWGETNSRGIT